MTIDPRTIVVDGIPVHIQNPLPFTACEDEKPHWFLVLNDGKPKELYVDDESLATEEKVRQILQNVLESQDEGSNNAHQETRQETEAGAPQTLRPE